jgi:hypothetical protein
MSRIGPATTFTRLSASLAPPLITPRQWIRSIADPIQVLRPLHLIEAPRGLYDIRGAPAGRAGH